MGRDEPAEESAAGFVAGNELHAGDGHQIKRHRYNYDTFSKVRFTLPVTCPARGEVLPLPLFPYLPPRTTERHLR